MDAPSATQTIPIRFIVGERYIRKKLHEEFGGQLQHGIVTPLNHPMILLFVGGKGQERGYYNFFKGERFHMYGEERTGKFEFNFGNKAVQDHVRDGKALHLFQILDDGHVEYRGEKVCVDSYRKDDGLNGKRPIIFILEDATTYQKGEREKANRLLWDRLLSYSSPENVKMYHTEQDKIARDDDIVEVKKLLYEYRCQICGWSLTTKSGGHYIEGAHIIPKKENGTEHPDNILILCPNHHKMFDDGVKTYGTKNGKVIDLIINGESLKVLHLEPLK